ncbi:hypothetical protein J7W19_10860 [Streptomyces mobaraensis NBRC 13819 = DSM 40847]|uniref:Uncharacterized protein n=2 Tax=Streptomyces mobaraensis TaxID=35621 RepID=A0A5N5WE83_STRMB|nr:hypothetical protein [Streptomyces mobaraensis]EME97191.1 hypothetical protein H340_27686 [Streptomyces mobaraensis NBRC 13819 = DSM 40847]KAB7850037.1 hypothetical protein FRZ00_05330 [Streptomyces mobaraensis]QTT73853.1 hypothetical protein J7W19_10860 [Streptomyces mobaraensis NBRC 13819 = DSM 40847]
MTTREELHDLIDRIDPDELAAVAALLHSYARRDTARGAAEPPYPRSVGILSEAPPDLSARVDDYLSDGFGR